MTSFLNAKDIEALRDHLLAIKERVDQGLRILNRDDPRGPSSRTEGHPGKKSPGGPSRPSARSVGPPGTKDIPEGAWMDDPATPKQLMTLEKAKVEYWDGITKGEASELIANLFKKVRP